MDYGFTKTGLHAIRFDPLDLGSTFSPALAVGPATKTGPRDYLYRLLGYPFTLSLTEG